MGLVGLVIGIKNLLNWVGVGLFFKCLINCCMVCKVFFKFLRK